MSLPDFTILPSLDDVQMTDFTLDFELEDIEQPTIGLDEIDVLLDPEQPEIVPQVNACDEFVFDARFLAGLTDLIEAQIPAQPEVLPQVTPEELVVDADRVADFTDLTETEMPAPPQPSLWHDRHGLPITGPSAGIPSPSIPFVPATPLPLQDCQHLQWPSSADGPGWWKTTLPPRLPARRAPFNPSRYLYLAESTLGVTGPDPPKCNPEFMWYGSGQTSFPPPGKPMPSQRGRRSQEDHDELDAQVPSNAYELRRALIPTLATTPDEEALRALLAPQMYAPHPLSLFPSSIRAAATTLTLLVRRRAKWLADVDTPLGASAAGPPPLIADVAPGHTSRLPGLSSPVDSPLTSFPERSLFCTPTAANVSFATGITDALRTPTPSSRALTTFPLFSPTPTPTPSPPPRPTTHRRRKHNLPRPDSKRLAGRDRAQAKRFALRAKWPNKSLAQAKKADAEDTARKAAKAKKARGKKVHCGRVGKAKSKVRDEEGEVRKVIERAKSAR